MTRDELAKIAQVSRCRLIGWEDAGNAAHRLVLARFAQAFDNSESALLCEPSLARRTTRPPDIVLIDPEVGVHVVEVKGIPLERIESIEAGGQIGIRYASATRARNPIAQVRSAMFDIRDATIRAFEREISFPFRYWVVFPFIERAAWQKRFGPAGFCPPELLFADDIADPLLARRLGARDRRGNAPIQVCPLDQLQCVWRAFGDTSVLYCTPIEREPRRAAEGTLGEQFDEAAEAYKALSDEQQRLSSMNWEGGPRLVRGVAGSGKTIVLANNLARRLERRLVAASESLFEVHAKPRLLAVCFNRCLAPFIARKIDVAFRQRTGRPIPPGLVEVCSFNSLMWNLSRAGLWRYHPIENADTHRAAHYLSELERIRQFDPALLQALSYDAIYVDEGQDFHEQEFRLLKELCRVEPGGEPSLYVFYDDAQNLYGRGRPNWQSIGLTIRGRSFVMTQCFRNTRPILEPTFNVLYGTCAAVPGRVPTRQFGDLGTLEQKGLIRDDNGFWRVRFAPREGAPPRISLCQNARDEAERIIERLHWLIGQQEVRPQDILVLSFGRQRILQLADAIRAAAIPGISAIHVAFEEKDHPLGQKGRLTLSTVASAKGYDAYCVLLASANRFPLDIKGRASFYVGCTRAIEYLEVFAFADQGLFHEMSAALGRGAGRTTAVL